MVTSLVSIGGTWTALMLVGMSPSWGQVLTLSGLVSAFLVPWKHLHKLLTPEVPQEKRLTLTPEALLALRPLTEAEQRELARRLQDAQRRVDVLLKQRGL